MHLFFFSIFVYVCGIRHKCHWSLLACCLTHPLSFLPKTAILRRISTSYTISVLSERNVARCGHRSCTFLIKRTHRRMQMCALFSHKGSGQIKRLASMGSGGGIDRTMRVQALCLHHLLLRQQERSIVCKSDRAIH